MAKRARKKTKKKKEQDTKFFLEKFINELDKADKMLGSAETYFSELILFNLAPEEVELQARPGQYITIVYIPNDKEYENILRLLKQLSIGVTHPHQCNENEIRKIDVLIDDYSFNIPQNSIYYKGKIRDEILWQSNKEKGIILFLKKGNNYYLMNRKIDKNKWIPELSTIFIKNYDNEKGLIFKRIDETHVEDDVKEEVNNEPSNIL